MNTSSSAGQYPTVFRILNLFNYPLSEAAYPPVSIVYCPIVHFDGIYTLMRVH